MSSAASTTSPAPLLASATRLPGERLAVVAVAATVALLPFLVPSGPLNTAPVDALMAVAIASAALWAGTHRIRLAFPYAAAVTVSMIAGGIGALAGPVPVAGFVALVQDIVLFSWGVTVVNIARSPENLALMLKAWRYGAVAWSIVVLVGLAARISFLSGVTPRDGARVAALFGDPNFAGNYFFVSIMIVWATRRPSSRILRVATYLLLISMLALTGSNGAAISLGVAAAIVATGALYRRYGPVQAIGGLALMVVAGLIVASTLSLTAIVEMADRSQYAAIRDGIGRGTTSVDQRGVLLHENVHLLYTGSILGSGPTSTKTRLDRSQAVFVKEAHSDYWSSIVERGILGLIGVCLLVGAVLARAWRIATRPLAPAFARVVVRPEALAGAAVGCLLAGTVLEVLHLRHVWFVFAVVAALSLWGRSDG